jgi:two-component system, LytTR family, response regulator
MRENFTAIIIDDEKAARTTLVEMLKLQTHTVEVIAQADSYMSGLQLLDEQQADIVFMDISLGSNTAFDILDTLPEGRKPKPIFVTAYEEFALKAYRYYAIDYILKPVSLSDLSRALNKVVGELQHVQMDRDEIAPSASRDFLIIPDRSNWHFINIMDIALLKGSGSYTDIVMDDGAIHTVSKGLGYFEKQLLSTSQFIKVHRSYMIHIKKIASLDKGNKEILLKNGSTAPISIRPEVLLQFCLM